MCYKERKNFIELKLEENYKWWQFEKNSKSTILQLSIEEKKEIGNVITYAEMALKELEITKEITLI